MSKLEKLNTFAQKIFENGAITVDIVDGIFRLRNGSSTLCWIGLKKDSTKNLQTVIANQADTGR